MELNQEYTNWSKYLPSDMHYVLSRYDMGIMSCARKIHDCHWSIAMGRIELLKYKDNEYASVFKESNMGNELVKTSSLYSALAYYNYTLDYSWQIIYFYCQNKCDWDFVYSKMYNEIEEKCKKKVLKKQIKICRLRDSKNLEALDELIDKFYTYDNTKCIRDYYHYLKHRGMIYTDLIGDSNEELHYTIQGVTAKKLPIKKINLDELYDKLVNFHNSIVEYISKIIDIIIPSEFTQDKNPGQFSANEFLTSMINQIEAMEKIKSDENNHDISQL
ncbi:MAG: hypothetical protein KZY57_02880 [Paeniclostridium sp.]|nr:hypothetical protein [Paeniclostridium sp.]MBW4861756.1 hypothetical protein [Paeniclostridium sp.]